MLCLQGDSDSASQIICGKVSALLYLQSVADGYFCKIQQKQIARKIKILNVIQNYIRVKRHKITLSNFFKSFYFSLLISHL